MMNRILSSVLFGLVGITTVMAADPSRPRLVVGIVIDQLRTDYLESLQTLFGEKGFRKLMKEGAFMKDVDFKVPELDPVNATAILYTGNYPNANGVPSASVYNPALKKSVAALADSGSMGNFTSDSFSPAQLRLSTVSDELAIDGGGLMAIYSVSPDPQQAVIMAGHAGSSAVWLDENTGKWASTTYYKDFPQPVSSRNYNRSVASRIDTMQWKPALPLEKYPGIPAQKRYYPFRYTFPRSDRDVYRMYASSPLVNAEVTDLAVDYLRDLRLGSRGDAIDMLNLAYTAAPYKYVKDGDYRLELEDTYVRLDSQLGRLFEAIDKYVGLQNAVIFVSSTGYYDDAVPDDPKFRIPSGSFSVKRAMSLLNSFLSAKYGNGDYVDTFAAGHLYLDHKTIEDRNLDAAEVAEAARGFLCRMSGVADARTLDDVLTLGKPGLENLRLSVDPKNAGDIYLMFYPGWSVVNDLTYPSPVKNVRSATVSTPAFLMAPGVKSLEITSTVDAVALASTITQTLRIRAPNGAFHKPLNF